MKIGPAAIMCTTVLMTSASAILNASPSKYRAPIHQKARECRMPLGWDTVAARKPQFVIFGEVHGTRQAPDFVGDVACALAARGERILVAIEHSATENAILQNAWNLSDA